MNCLKGHGSYEHLLKAMNIVRPEAFTFHTASTEHFVLSPFQASLVLCNS